MPKKEEQSINFTHQLILNFFEEEETLQDSKALQSDWNQKNPIPCLAIDIDGDYDFSAADEKILKYIATIDDISKLRVYILGHSAIKSQGITNESGDPYENSEMANFLAIHFKCKTASDHCVVINVIACNYGSAGFESGAADLQLQLKNLDIHALVVARIQMTMIVNPDEPKNIGRKATFDVEQNKCVYKKPGSKIVFFADEKGRQISADAYEYLWQRETLIMLDRCEGKCIFPGKSKKIALLFQEIEKQTPRQALKTLEEVASRPKSFIDDDDKDDIISFFSEAATETRRCINQAIKKGRKIISGESIPTFSREIPAII